MNRFLLLWLTCHLWLISINHYLYHYAKEGNAQLSQLSQYIARGWHDYLQQFSQLLQPQRADWHEHLNNILLSFCFSGIPALAAMLTIAALFMPLRIDYKSHPKPYYFSLYPLALLFATTFLYYWIQLRAFK
ncbi:MAG: hypothetical protein Q4A74_04000 [Cardiobacteriaceae bacterium]|nr:hypothetical protein [Cardiobacteriaceae bacterium]